MTTIHLPIYVVEAFSSSPFGGNPAAVVPLERWLSDALMQSIAAQSAMSVISGRFNSFFGSSSSHVWNYKS